MGINGGHPHTNFSHYDKIDRLIEAARVEILPETQISLWEQAQIRILDDMAAIPSCTPNSVMRGGKGSITVTHWSPPWRFTRSLPNRPVWSRSLSRDPRLPPGTRNDMKIYSKILVTTLPLAFCLVLATVGTAYHFSRAALTEMAKSWLDARLSEAMKVLVSQETMLRRYRLETIPASITKAQLDAGTIIAGIDVGEKGCIFAISASGRIVVHPQAGMVGTDVSAKTWFKRLATKSRQLIYETDQGPNLAMVAYFAPWDWYVLASDPEHEIYGVARRMTPYLFGISIAGFLVMAGVLMLLTRWLAVPLRQLTVGAEKFGRGELNTRIAIQSQDEFGRLASVFNQMAGQLQGTLTELRHSHQQLEDRVTERTSELFHANARLRQEIKDRERMSREKDKLQDQLLQAQKMKAIGTLAGGIAHDFNNLLMGIQGNVELMALDLGPNHEQNARLGTIRECIHSGTRLTQQLLGFARLGKYEVKATNPNELVDKCIDMFGRTRQEVRILTHFSSDIWAVNVDQGQIEQVMLNLLINAWQAMPDGGTITLATTNETLDRQQVELHQANPDNYVRISISDTGIGMEKTTLTRIFDPFFTTKTMKRGTGLGLASAYGIIRNHGGFIDVQSQIGQGTTFHVYLKALHTERVDITHPPHPPRKAKAPSCWWTTMR